MQPHPEQHHAIQESEPAPLARRDKDAIRLLHLYLRATMAKSETRREEAETKTSSRTQGRLAFVPTCVGMQGRNTQQSGKTALRCFARRKRAADTSRLPIGSSKLKSPMTTLQAEVSSFGWLTSQANQSYPGTHACLTRRECCRGARPKGPSGHRLLTKERRPGPVSDIPQHLCLPAKIHESKSKDNLVNACWQTRRRGEMHHEYSSLLSFIMDERNLSC